MNSYAVIFSYSDDDAAVYLFSSEPEALDFLKSAYNSELEIRNQIPSLGATGFISKDRKIAQIKDNTNDVVDIMFGRVYS